MLTAPLAGITASGGIHGMPGLVRIVGLPGMVEPTAVAGSAHTVVASAGAVALSVLPLSILASWSPVVFLNASTVASNEGERGALRFLAGNALVLVVIGGASIGLLGATAADDTARALASRWVDAVLALVLIGYAVKLIRTPPAPPSTEPDQTPSRGVFAWGVVGMLTNFTTLPLYVSVAQRLGASPLPAVVNVVYLVVATVIVLAPAWIPALVFRFAPDKVGVSPRWRLRIAHGTRWASVVACCVGATFLLWHATAGLR